MRNETRIWGEAIRQEPKPEGAKLPKLVVTRSKLEFWAAVCALIAPVVVAIWFSAQAIQSLELLREDVKEMKIEMRQVVNHEARITALELKDKDK